MKFKLFIASLTIAGLSLSPVIMSAQELGTDESLSVTPVVLSLSEHMQVELADLKLKELDPTTGFMNRFFIRIKIKELENKLNIATALQ